jgi:hypothetical protein
MSARFADLFRKPGAVALGTGSSGDAYWLARRGDLLNKQIPLL